MKIVFMGTPDFAVPVLEELIHSRHEVIAVVSQPDRPKGRGKSVAMTPVKEKALEYNLPVYQPEKAREESFLQFMEELKPDAVAVVAYGQILTKRFLDIPKYGCVNVHASLLPAYRGAAPIQWAVIDGLKETGVTTQMMDIGVDTGDILKTKVITLDEKETGGSLFDRLSLLGGPLLVETLNELEDGTLTRTPQDHEKATHAKMLNKAMGNLDFTKSAEELERLIRGLNPWPSAYTSWNGHTLKVWDASVLEEISEMEPGTVCKADGKNLYVACGKGILVLNEVQLEGKKRMAVDAFLRGYDIPAGTVLGK